MDSSPPSRRSDPRLRSKSASRLPLINDFNGKEASPLDLTPCSPKRTLSAHRLTLQTSDSVSLQDLLLSPSPRPRRSKARLFDRTEMVEEPIDPVVCRRRCKSRASPLGLLSCASPRNNRRSRRRLESETREDRELGLGEENAKPRKRRQSGRSRKEKLSLVPSASVPSLSLPPKICDDDLTGVDHIGQLISDLIMWKDVAKSSLWFGFGSLCILSSCFTSGLRCSVFSTVSQLGFMFLAVSFFYNSVSQRNKDDRKLDLKLKEDDIVRVARVVLPAVNLVIAKMMELFSGDPLTTLKLAPILLFGAEYGHLITLWRLCAIGFFVSFTIPKLYSCYSIQINRKVEHLRSWVWEAWGACYHKKVVVASSATFFWNLSSMKTRIFTAFISVVVLRYYRQQSGAEIEEEVEGGVQSQSQQQQALVVVEHI